MFCHLLPVRLSKCPLLSFFPRLFCITHLCQWSDKFVLTDFILNFACCHLGIVFMGTFPSCCWPERLATNSTQKMTFWWDVQLSTAVGVIYKNIEYVKNWPTNKKDKTLPTRRTLNTSVSKRMKSILTDQWLKAAKVVHAQRLPETQVAQDSPKIKLMVFCNVRTSHIWTYTGQRKSCHLNHGGNARENWSQLTFYYFVCAQ